MVGFGLFITLVLIEYFLSPRIDWYVSHIQEDVRIYQFILWYGNTSSRKFKKLFQL